MSNYYEESLEHPMARVAELEMHLAAAAETIAQHARADAAAWGASFEQQNEHAANATANLRALLVGGMPVRDDTQPRGTSQGAEDRSGRARQEGGTMSETYQTVEAQRNALRIERAELEAQRNAVLDAVLGEDWELSGSDDSVSIAEMVTAHIDALEAQLDAARLLLVAIDENLDMDVNPLTITTGRIVELLRDPARNPWAGLMRAVKEER